MEQDALCEESPFHFINGSVNYMLFLKKRSLVYKIYFCMET